MQLTAYKESPFQIKLCFDKIIAALELKADDPSGNEPGVAKSLLEKINLYPELRFGIKEVSLIENQHALIRELLADLFPAQLSLNEIKAINIPYTNLFFNLTRRFRNILDDAGSYFDMTIRDQDEHQFYVLSCCIILNAYYKTQLDFGRPLFYDIPTGKGTIKHYRILYNADFLEIIPTPDAIPLTPEDIQYLLDNYDDLGLWKSKFPPNSWILKGFAIMTLFDSSTENAVSSLKEKLLESDVSGFSEHLGPIFQSLFQDPDLKIGFSLYNQSTDSFSREILGQQMHSILLLDRQKVEARAFLGENIYHQLVLKKLPLAVSDTASFKHDSALVRTLVKEKVASFILVPVVKNDNMLGLLEIISPTVKKLNTINVHKLDVIMPFITGTIERMLFQLQNEVQAIIQDNYTAIHNSIYWKFREEAQIYMQEKRLKNKYELGEIVFADIYPLYGQVDIKDSSETRNTSLQLDLQAQLKALLFLVQALNEGISHLLLESDWQLLNSFYDELETAVKADTEQQINNFLEHNIHPALKTVNTPEIAKSIGEYFKNTDKLQGAFHAHRRKYEKTIALINDTMGTVIDESQIEIQKDFPHYFERFKTDGIEHSIYIGPSISASKNFSIEQLHKIRAWQLRVIISMESAHRQLLPSLPIKLQVRSLVLVFNATISIRFRMDEKRFDVDGSYNIRYEIIKKRIDKAYIKHSAERIAETGKLSIVYSGIEDETEYLSYIQTLQEEGLLGKNIEKYEVEDLRGVAGLKLLRIPIIYK